MKHLHNTEDTEILFKNNILFSLLLGLLYTWHNLCFFIIKNKTIREHIRKLNFKPGLNSFFLSGYTESSTKSGEKGRERQKTK